MIADPKEGDLVQITYGIHVGKFGRVVRVVHRSRMEDLIFIDVKGEHQLMLYPCDMELA